MTAFGAASVPSRHLRYNVLAEAELQGIVERYEDLKSGLGLRFLDAVNKKTDEILESPRRWRLFGGSRRVLLARFPYGIVYREISEEEVEVVAVAHLKRRPTYWRAR